MSRLLDLVKEQGISAFTYDDVKFVSKPLLTNPDRLILVGGQAVEVWGVLLNVAPPTGVALTEDTDWLGSSKDAQWLIDSLGPIAKDLQFPDKWDPSPGSALAFIQRDNRILMMDFMRSIIGPNEDVIKRLAVRVTLMDDVTLTVLHPLHCLESRLANLAIIPEKRMGNGPIARERLVAQGHGSLKRGLTTVLGAKNAPTAKWCIGCVAKTRTTRGPTYRSQASPFET